MNRDGYRDQIVTCDVGVSLHPMRKTHPLFMKYSNGTSTQCYAYHYPSLFPVLFLQFPFLIFHSLVSTLFLRLKQIACLLLLLRQPFLTYGRIQSIGLCTQYTNEMCAPFCTSPNCSTDSSPQNVLTCKLALGQEAVATRLREATYRLAESGIL